MALRTASRLGVDASVRVARLPSTSAPAWSAAPIRRWHLRWTARTRGFARSRESSSATPIFRTTRRVATRRPTSASERSGCSGRLKRCRRKPMSDLRGRSRRPSAAVQARHRRLVGERLRRTSVAVRARPRRRGPRSSGGRPRSARGRPRRQAAQVRANETRLDALDEKAEALEEEEEALIARDEAKRLARAAETAKEQRKRSPGGSAR